MKGIKSRFFNTLSRRDFIRLGALISCGMLVPQIGCGKAKRAKK
jgi:hypothetical protein